MNKMTFVLVLLAAIVGAIVPFCLESSDVLGQTHYYSSLSPLKKFSSYEELKTFITASSRVRPYYYQEPSGGSILSANFAGETKSILMRQYGLESNAMVVYVPSYSKTNIQVEGVDEADVIKTDGEYIYLISGKNVTIVKAYPAEEAEILFQIELDGTLRGAFINGDKLVIFEETHTNGTLTRIKVYDVSDRENPHLKRDYSTDGNYFNSRMIGDYVYAVINHGARLIEGEVSLPKIHSNRGVEEIDVSGIYYSDVPDYAYTFTTIVALNTQNDEEEPTHESILLGAARGMYVSLNNIYVTFPEVERTLIYRIHIEGNKIEFAANGEVPGYVLNQFSMDEHLNYFRIATTTGHVARSSEQATSRNHVYILDMNLRVVGMLEDLASGEKIYSARFMGDRCYLVTFRKIDPLFVIDLKNPDEPRVLGELKITGYSDYLHPYDENHIIGVGKETVAAEQGDFSWYQGVKISLFDVSDVENPKEIDKYEIGDRGTDSPVLTDHKAFLFDRSKNLLVLPVLVAEISEEKHSNGFPPSRRGDYIWQGAYVFDVSLSEGLVLKGGVTHVNDDADLMKSGYYSPSSYSVKRSLYIDNVLYTISDKKIKMNSLETLDEINEVELP
jgi:uncharacterized secreted protein with C-terminal beta-propeller domain